MNDSAIVMLLWGMITVFIIVLLAATVITDLRKGKRSNE
jgi:hypothetical protein